MDVLAFQANSGESELLDVRYDGELLVLTVLHGETESIVDVVVRTRHVYSSFRRGIRDTCHFAVSRLDELVGTKSGVYSPSESFSQFMAEARSHVNLAYGLRVSQFQYIAQVVGGVNVVAVVRGMADIRIVPSSADASAAG